MTKIQSLLTVIIASSLWMACTPDILEEEDPAVRRSEDIAEINTVIAENGWSTPDTTESGARFLIFKEGSDSQENIKQHDIVYFDYIGYYLDGNVFDTSIPLVADTAFSFVGDIVFEPVSYTYTETGWSLRYVPVVSQYLNGPNLSTAMMEALSVSFGQMTVGDRVLVFLPSAEATTQSNSASAQAVYFEIIIKQILSSEG
jgi:hypothetical protein